MNGMLIRNWMTVGLLAIAIVAVGCASTSNIANKATFGLVGGDDDPAAADRKAQEREAKQAEKERKAAEKRAKKEEQGDRGLLNRATFGLAGGDSDAAKEEKSAEKEAKQQAEAERKAAKQERDRLNREAKAQRDAEKQAKKAEKSERSLLSRATFGVAGTDSEEERQRKEAEAAAKREEEAQRKAERQAEKEAKREAKSERSLLNKATFGLAGTETEAEREEREAKEAAEREEREAKEAVERAEREAAKEQKRAENAERSRLNRLTLGLAGTETEAEREEREAREAAQRAEREAEEEQKRAENAERSRLNRLTLGLAGTETEEERQQREAEEAAKREEKRQAELAKQEENANKTWLNRTTYGVLGEDYNDDALVAMAESDPDSLTPEQLEKAEQRKQAIADHQARQNIESFSDPEARKLAGYPFNTEVISRVTPKGNEVTTATTETYSRADYGIVDVGDVRIAVRGQTFKSDPRRSRIIVASNDRGPAQGSLGVGNQQLAYLYEQGTTSVTFGEIAFTVADSVLSVDGVTVPVGEGRKLVVVEGAGAAQTYDIDP